jgi:hypothetical protein
MNAASPGRASVHDSLDTAGTDREDTLVVKQPLELPTIPSLPALGGGTADRSALLAGLAFIEGAAAGFLITDLLDWFSRFQTVLNMKAPTAVSDTGIGTIALAPGVRVASDRTARLEDLPKLLTMAKLRVIFTLRGLLSKPADDRFLQAAIFAGRVQRDRGRWVAKPKGDDRLSDIVLSLFAVDVLSHRNFHEQNLCICDVCGRLSFNPSVTTRAGCAAHVPRRDAPGKGSAEDD